MTEDYTKIPAVISISNNLAVELNRFFHVYLVILRLEIHGERWM